MKVFALYGTTGTGKSSSALELAHRLQIEAIIDDGILIYQGRKVAGTSAKYEKTKIRAVKRAIFHFADHAQEVQTVLKTLPIKRLLVLGTSQRMISRIVETLDLPSVHEYIPIETIKPEEEIQAAQYVRSTEGKHAMPLPRIEVEKDFFQRIISSAKQILSAQKEVIGETTIVQPAFAGGRIQIYEQVLRKLVQHACYGFPEVTNVSRVTYAIQDLPRLSIAVSLQVDWLQSLPSLVEDIQLALCKELVHNLNIAPASVDVHVLGLEIVELVKQDTEEE